jgi:hypothetical protein
MSTSNRPVRVAAAVAVAVAGFLLPATASATEVLGAVSDAGACSDDASYVAESVASGPDYIADAPGVVTTYSMTASSDLATTRLLVLQPGVGTTYTLLQEDAARTQTASNAVNTQTDVHLPIAAGQTIGIFVPAQAINEGWCLDFTGNALDRYRDFSGEPPLNSSSAFSAHPDDIRLNLAATVEPDADNDRYGDETQDSCLGSAGASTGCPSTVAIDQLGQKGRKAKVTATVSVPGQGTLTVGSPTDPALAAAAKKSLNAVTTTLTVKTKQQVTLTLKLTKSAKRKLAQKGKLKTQVKAVYTPPGGPPTTAQGKVKLRT